MARPSDLSFSILASKLWKGIWQEWQQIEEENDQWYRRKGEKMTRPSCFAAEAAICHDQAVFLIKPSASVAR